MNVYRSNVLNFEEFKLLANTALCERMLRNKHVLPAENIISFYETQKWSEAMPRFIGRLDENAHGLVAVNVDYGNVVVYFEQPQNSSILSIYNAV